ncbi:MAG: 2-amino-4-hydroxy-6-hydroxymethyldihydropteridine diphosphokinase [Spirochaetales bacterium]|nr:2-amino-4-hydroxy-6-hydroxymethyldihydropteridine diphosphokinase [Spirochaetales bacterium]
MSGAVFIGVGANINPEANILKAVQLLGRQVKLLDSSFFYRSKAAGKEDQPDFINGVLKITTEINPGELKFDVLRKIEAQLGRVRTKDKNAPRPIDLDILLYGGVVKLEEQIRIPDPHIQTYDFVYVPLLELEPELVLPDSKQKLKALVEIDKSCHKLVKMVEFSALVKERCGL